MIPMYFLYKCHRSEFSLTNSDGSHTSINLLFTIHGATIFYLSTRGRWMVSLMHQLLFPWGYHFWYPLDSRLVGPKNLSGCYGEEKNLVLARIQTQAIQPLSRCCTELSWLMLVVIRHCLSPVEPKAFNQPSHLMVNTLSVTWQDEGDDIIMMIFLFSTSALTS
jgi:hypothetical protein